MLILVVMAFVWLDRFSVHVILSLSIQGSTLITRDNEVLTPKGNSRLQGWDQVTVLARIVDEDQVREALLKPFEQPDDEAPANHEVGPDDTNPGHSPESSTRS